MDTDIKKLRQIVTVARHGSFSRAAEELHITQPALSRSIAAFEARFGVRIFERGRKGVTLTVLGIDVVNKAEDLLRRVRSFDHNLHLSGRGDAGKVALGMGPLVASIALPGLSTHFLQHRPRLRLHTISKPATALLTELLDDRIEMMFCAQGLVAPHEDLEVRPLGHMRLAMLVRASHPLAGKEVTLSEVAAFPLLSGVEMTALAMESKCGAFICDNYHILREAALNTDGVWMSSPQFASEDLRTERLAKLALVDNPQPPQVTICLIRRRDRTPSPTAVAVVDHVREIFSASG